MPHRDEFMSRGKGKGGGMGIEPWEGPIPLPRLVGGGNRLPTPVSPDGSEPGSRRSGISDFLQKFGRKFLPSQNALEAAGLAPSTAQRQKEGEKEKWLAAPRPSQDYDIMPGWEALPEAAPSGEEGAAGEEGADLEGSFLAEQKARTRLLEVQANEVAANMELERERFEFDAELDAKKAQATETYQRDLIRLQEREQLLDREKTSAIDKRERYIAEGNWIQAAEQRALERELDTQRAALSREQMGLDRWRFEQEMGFRQNEQQFNQKYAMKSFELQSTQLLSQIFSNPMALAAFARTGAPLPGGIQLPSRPDSATGRPFSPQETARWGERQTAERFTDEALGGVNPLELAEIGERSAPRGGLNVRRV